MKLAFNKQSFLYLIMITAAVLIIGWPSLFNDFSTLDDPNQIISNPDIVSLDSTHLRKLFSSFYLGMYQPLASLTYAIEYQLWGAVANYNHAVNLLLHIINAWLIYLLAIKILKRKTLAFFLALLFAIHPVQVETVAWTSARSNLLLVIFLSLIHI